jgi:hypothetical protein
LAIAQLLRLDNSAARRRLLKALSLGLIVNHETKRGQPGRYRVVDQVERAGDILPIPEELMMLVQHPRKTVPSCHWNQKPIREQDDSGGKTGGKPVTVGDPTAAGGKMSCHLYTIDNKEEMGPGGTVARDSGGNGDEAADTRFEERAAELEFGAGYTREEAEALAAEDLGYRPAGGQ